MSEMTFTPAQQDAVNATGGSVIVSAAAGSGKTRVLVQRVIRLLTDADSPLEADRLLMVTFTKAAADEMRSRISDAIDKKLFYEPNNSMLRRQQVLLANADICTIHSFCSRIIRENFYLLDIDQDFRIITEGEAAILRQRLLSEMIEERLASGDQGFIALSEVLSSSRTDRNMEKILLDVYDSACSHPFPDIWLSTVSGFYDPDIPLENTRYAMVAMDKLRAALSDMSSMLCTAQEVIMSNPAFCTGAATSAENKLNYLRSFLDSLSRSVQSDNWNTISDCISSFGKYKYMKPRSKKLDFTEEECIIIQNVFDYIDNTVIDGLRPIFGISRETYQSSTQELYPAVVSMCSLLKDFGDRYFSAKKERGVLDFSDLEHLMLKLLVDVTDRGYEKTPFAKALSEHYDQIMVDEYQDTNETQETIFRFLSRDESNLFVVGDIKQSIYRFREAMPEIFKRRRSSSTLYDRNAPAFPAKIILDRNFRSREGIIDSVNFIFRSVMSERVGEIEYNDEEKLTVGADYPETNDTSLELHLLDIESTEDGTEDEGEEENTYQREARYIASIIKKKVAEGMLIKDGDRQRPVTYGDFAVLMRFLSSHGQEYADVLNSCGIPAYIDKPYSLFGCYEVNILISLLKIIDNPLQDIPMLALLLSPVFGFTADDLADLKTGYKGRFIFNRLCRCLDKDEEKASSLYAKCRYFSDVLAGLRRLSVTVSASRLLNGFFEQTGYICILSAASNGGIRVHNIRKFMSFVNDYEKSGKSSIADLVRYINYLEENGTDITAEDSAPVDSVRIMTIHHSKGLEYPVVIMAGMNAKGNSGADEVLCHADLGLGLKRLDRSDLTRYNTLQRNVIASFKASEEISEAMRVFYVALTRAKEKIISVVSYPRLNSGSIDKKIKAIASSLSIADGRISPMTVGSTLSLADWMVMCALIHPDMKELRADAGRPELAFLPTASRWEYHRIRELPEDEQAEVISDDRAEYDTGLCTLLSERSCHTYSHSQRTTILSKVSASALVHKVLIDRHIASSRPAFMQEGALTGAEKGTAVHTFLQHADFSSLGADPEGELDRLVREGFLTPVQASVIEKQDIDGFVRSEIYRHIISCQRILREHRFTVNIPASDIDPSYPQDEKVILQGAIDCMIFEPDGIIIVDYKTDRVKSMSELCNRYALQLKLYKRAADQLFDLPVKKCCIYSISLAQETDVPLD